MVTVDELSAQGDYYTDFILAQVVFMREGGNLHFVTQTTSGTHDVFSDVRVIAAEGAERIHLHGTKVNNWWLDGKIDKVENY